MTNGFSYGIDVLTHAHTYIRIYKLRLISSVLTVRA